MDLSNLDYFTVVIVLIALAVVWGILQRVLKFTVRVFACGCAVIAGMALGIFVLVNWGEIARALGL
ncbi:MAG: hypothetical protein RMK99_02530 [Anaerolineales bacterium]|nr:hypothetical protein [Anaerolineales bacterium]